MSITTLNNFKVYNDYVQSGLFESIAQNTQAFNGASANTLVAKVLARKGNFAYSSFFKNAAGVSRRDIGDVSAVTPVTLTMDEEISVKLNRRWGPFQLTLDAIKKLGNTPEEVSYNMGLAFGEQKVQDWLNSSLSAAAAALGNVAANTLDITGDTTKTLTAGALADAIYKLGDKAGQVRAFVMHSAPYKDLMKDAIANKIYGEANLVVYGAAPGTLGRHLIVTVSPALVVAGTPNLYHTLALVENSIVVEESESPDLVSLVLPGLANLTLSLQGEFAFNLGVKGFKFDVANGGVNPDATALTTGSNWDQVATSTKDLAGVCIISQ